MAIETPAGREGLHGIALASGAIRSNAPAQPPMAIPHAITRINELLHALESKVINADVVLSRIVGTSVVTPPANADIAGNGLPVELTGFVIKLEECVVNLGNVVDALSGSFGVDNPNATLSRVAGR